MYMAGRKRTASKPSSTLILLESYTSAGVISLVAIVETQSFSTALGTGTLSHSNAHGHHDVAVLVSVFVIAFVISGAARGPQLAGAIGILEVKGNLLLIGGPEEVQQVAGIESDLHRRSVVLGRQALFALTGCRQR